MPHLEELRDLISLTKKHLLNEHALKEWRFCDEETYNFFKEKAQGTKKATLKAKTPPPPPAAPIEFKKDVPAPAPVAKETPKKEVAKPVAKVQVETPPKTEPVDFSDIQKILKERFPSLTLLDGPPDDSEAKKANENNAVIGEVVVLSFDRKTSPFLKNITTAIQQEITSCTLISASRLEGEKEWENLLRQKQLKLILSTDYGLFSMPGAMQYFREVPKKAKSFLGNIPLLLLTDLSLYLKEPKLKPTLWRAICQMLKK